MFGDFYGQKLQDQDLFSFLLTKYLANCNDEKQEPDLSGYLAFARRTLITNPPVSIRYLASGLGVQLTSGEILAFTSDQLGVRPMIDEGTSIIATKESIAASTVAQARQAPDNSISLAEVKPTVQSVVEREPEEEVKPAIEEPVKPEEHKHKKPHHHHKK